VLHLKRCKSLATFLTILPAATSQLFVLVLHVVVFISGLVVVVQVVVVVAGSTHTIAGHRMRQFGRFSHIYFSLGFLRALLLHFPLLSPRRAFHLVFFYAQKYVCFFLCVVVVVV